MEHLHRLDDDDGVGAVDNLPRLDMHLCDDGREWRNNRIGRTVRPSGGGCPVLGTGKPGERMALASNIDHTVDGRAGDRFDFMNVAVEVAHGNGPARSVRGEPPIACAPWAGPGFAVGGDGSRLQHAVVDGKLGLVEEARGDAAGSEPGTVDQPAVETAIGDDATEEEPVETVAKTGDGRLRSRRARSAWRSSGRSAA